MIFVINKSVLSVIRTVGERNYRRMTGKDYV